MGLMKKDLTLVDMLQDTVSDRYKGAERYSMETIQGY